MKLGIDLSLRSAGLCFNNEFKLIQITKLNDEELLIEISNQICSFIHKCKPNEINIEGLSFNSISGSKDIIAGNFWYLRCRIHCEFPDIPINIIPVTQWRNPLFTKEERKQLKENVKILKENKISLKGLIGEERKEAQLKNKELELNASIKYNTFLKLPDDIKNIINNITQDEGRWDLTDAYWISRI